ncbi:MAG: M20/M25/M40 family metallo-hydrolase, partial [candidate division WOR-3 bacterium]
MKGLSIFVTITLLIFNYLHAQSVLAAVKINDQEQLQLWHDLSYSSYAFFENTVISEVSHSDVLVLEGQNFHCLIIDEAPWTEPYFICTVPSDLELSLPGEIIWHSNRIYLIKLPKNRISELKNIPVKFKQLTKSTLPDRFWTGMDTKVVPVQSVQWDPFIQSLVDQVNTDSLTSYIQRLQDFRTRLMLSDSSYAASAWLRQKFTSWGYAAEFDSFYLDLEWPGVGYERNVIATIDGTIAPSKIFIIGGHVDSYVTDTAIARVYAPGADDNASSVAAVLEAARILKGYTWKKTIKFMGCNGEEMGCHGSDHYAAYAESLGLDIGGVINLDMIGYMDDASLDCNIMRCHSFSQWLSDLFYQVGQVYIPSLLLYQETWAAGWDDYSFAIRGYPAICGSERWWYNNFHVHDTTDVLSEMFPLLYTSVTKVAVATVALLGLYPGMVEDVVVFDAGNGGSLVVNWSANYESDVVGYKVYWGRQSEMYTDTHFVAGLENTTDTLTGLMADSIYYVAVNAVDVDSRESYLATEVTGIPRAIPLTPAGVIATPIISGVRIDWEPNQELDFAGYRVYRRVNDDPVYDSLNSVLLPDTTFTNAPLSGANKYYYAVRAFDMDGNASPMSSEVYGRPITLDQGIVIVDETRNSPFPPNPPPPDSLQDAFYQYILEGYRYTECDFDSLVQGLVFADFVPYSTVLWHADDYSEHMAEDNVEALRDYLDVGGRLWFVGWRPTSDLTGVAAYPADFGPGDFMYDYLKISHVDLSVMSDSFQA